MNKIIIIMFAFLGIFINAEVTLAKDNPALYQLRQGDSLQISVWREETLQKQLIVLPDGSITFPLIGRIEVAGLSTPELTQHITTKLKEFFPDPVVTIVITSIEGNRAYITGKVLRPGSFIITGPTTVLQAISLVGGLDKFADEGGIKVIRTKGDLQEVLPIRYKDIISGKDMATNIKLQSGDTLVVP